MFDGFPYIKEGTFQHRQKAGLAIIQRLFSDYRQRLKEVVRTLRWTTTTPLLKDLNGC